MKIRLKGSYTVEAALIFPFIMGVIVFIIFISFYLHDRAVMESCAYQAALKGSLERKDIGEMEKEARKAAEYNISGLLLATEDLSTEVGIEGKRVTVRYSGVLRIPQGALFMRIAGTDHIDVRGEGQALQKDAIEFIRNCRSVSHIAGKVAAH
ncbi:MAG: pilus assembly protein [Lachnospiraceae bacterium]|nr:pilus assembly protein [Lachnospiraceae bacterium]